jgi:DNA-binding transcriptional LysR family regulator
VAEPNLDDLAVFVRVVNRGGFASAARELGTPTSTVSRAVDRLESTAGVRLLHRTTRTVRPTTEGRELYAAVASSVATLRSAARSLEPAARQPNGRLRVTAPADLATAFLPALLVEFAERYPLVTLDFALTNQHSNLVDEGFDVALRATARLDDSSLVARKLGELEQRLYASPMYLQKRGTPRTWKDLEAHACVLFRAKELARTWSLRSAAGVVDVPVRGRVGGDDFTFVRAMVLAGAGIGILPHVNAAADEAGGRLVRVLPQLHARGATLYVVYPSAKNVPPRVTAFRDFVTERFGAGLAQQSSAPP